jgi:hypothetical protein
MRPVRRAHSCVQAIFLATTVLAIGAAQAQETSTQAQAGSSGVPVHFQLAAGVGGGYELVGLAFGVQVGHLEPFLSFGYTTLAGGLTGGLRLLLRDDGRSTPFLTLQGGRLIGISGENNDIVNNVWELAAIAGYRFSAEHAFVNLGIGPAVYWSWWNTPPTDFTTRIAFDVDLGVGVRF